MATVYGYARASTLEQQDTLESQREAIIREFQYRWAPKGYTLGPIAVDSGISGGMALRQRPAGLIMCANLQPGDAVVITKLDRGFRSVKDLLDTVDFLTAMGVNLTLLDCAVDTSTAAGRMFVTLLGAFAEFERQRLSERVRETWAIRRAKGLMAGGRIPYGFRPGGPKGARRLVRDDYTRKVGAIIVDLRTQGHSFDAIYFHFLRHNIKRRNQSEWSRATIARAYIAEVRLRRAEAKMEAAVQDKLKKSGLTDDSPEGNVTPDIEIEVQGEDQTRHGDSDRHAPPAGGDGRDGQAVQGPPPLPADPGEVRGDGAAD